jgi:hypothetical protein
MILLGRTFKQRHYGLYIYKYNLLCTGKILTAARVTTMADGDKCGEKSISFTLSDNLQKAAERTFQLTVLIKQQHASIYYFPSQLLRAISARLSIAKDYVELQQNYE